MKIHKLSLTNFRRFENKTVEFDKNWTIIVAPNAQGKSTIIEAIHLLATGDSPWTNDTSTMFRKPPKEERQKDAYTKLVNGTIRLQAEIESEHEFKNLTISVQKKDSSITTKYEDEGSPTTKNRFAANLHTILFSPHMIDLLMFEPRQRRKFLNDQISRTDLYYSDLITKYRKVRRQRNSLLKAIRKRRFKEHGAGPSESQKKSMKFWTEQLIDIGSQIIQKRIEFIEEINSSLSDRYESELAYESKVNISQLETLAGKRYIEDVFDSQLRSSYQKEQSIGTTIVGPHRDDWHLQAKDNTNLNIYGSRGEKRMAIADIMFKINNFLETEIGDPPIILLDDISSELDQENINIMFEEKINPEQQAVITTVNLNQIPKKARDEAQIIEL